MKKIIIAISGSIAAYKANEIVRQLFHDNWQVQVLLTHNALHFISPLTLENLSGRPVYWEEFSQSSASENSNSNNSMPHIELRKDLDVFALIPATANTIGKIANGIADNLLSSTILALEEKTKVLIAPAMNPNMYKHPALQGNLEKLKSFGYHIVEPVKGAALCGDEGQGKLASRSELLQAINNLLS